MPRPRLLLAVALAVLAAAGCGGDQTPSAQPATTAAPTSTASATTTAPTTTTAAVTRAQARTIALRAAGGGRVTDVEQDDEDNRPVWKVKVTKGSTKRKVSIDQQTGKVLKIETDTDSDGND